MGVISDQNYQRYWEFVVGATASTGPFPINFPFRDEDEVKVFVGGVAETGYSVLQASQFSIEGNEVTLDAPVSNTLVVIASDTGAVRTIGENFVAAELSVEIDRVFALFQELRDFEGRALRMGAGTDAIAEIAPVRENYTLIRTAEGWGEGFDAEGLDRVVADSRAWAESPTAPDGPDTMSSLTAARASVAGALAAQNYKNEAAASAVEAALYDGPKVDTFAELASVTPAMLAVDGYIRCIELNAVYKREPEVKVDPNLDYSGSGGVKLRYLPDQGRVDVRALGEIDTTGATDCVAVVQKAVDILPLGGTILLPHGTLRWEDELLVQTPSIRWEGTGRRKVYPGLFAPSDNVVTTIVPVHTKTAAVRFFNAAINMASAFNAENLNFATLETGDMPVCCFGFDGSGNFHRDYSFTRVGIFGFTSAFDTYNTGGDTAFGLIKIVDCAINRNTWIARNLTGQWNGFLFERNEAGQNGNATNGGGGIDIKAQAATIANNALEGQQNTIKVTGTYRGTRIYGNYFELNSGDYVIFLNSTDGAYIGTNFWQNITATQKIRLFADNDTTIDDKIIPSTDSTFGLTSHHNSIDPVPTGAANVAMFADASFVQSLAINAPELGGYQVTAPAGPHYTIPNSAGLLYTSAATGLTTTTKSGLTIAAGDYMMAMMVVSYEDEPAIAPRFITTVVGGGSSPGIYYNFNRGRQLKRKSVLYCGIVKATAAATQFQVQYYPFGFNPAAGLKCYTSPLVMYNLGPTVPTVLNGGSAVELAVPDSHVQTASTKPTTGAWLTGHRIRYRAPAAGAKEGMICIGGGSPGTWKDYGAIDA